MGRIYVSEADERECPGCATRHKINRVVWKGSRRQVVFRRAGRLSLAAAALLLLFMIPDTRLAPLASSKYGRQVLEFTDSILVTKRKPSSKTSTISNNDRSKSRRILVTGMPLTEEDEYQSTKGAPPPGYKKWLEYAKDRQCHLGPYKRIDRELQIFKDSDNPQRQRITKEQIHLAKQLREISVFKIQNGTLYNTTELIAGQIEMDMLEDMRIAQYLPDMEFIFTSGSMPRILLGNDESVDARFAAQCTRTLKNFHRDRHLHGYFTNRLDWFDGHLSSKLIPIFSHSKIDGCHADIQIPSPHHWFYEPLLSKEQWDELLPWSQRTNTLYFRGTTSGGHFAKGQNLTQAHRLRLVRMAKDNPHMDMGFTSFTNCLDDTCERLEELYGLAPYVEPMDTFKSKFLMSIDGVVAPARIPKLLSSGSLVFKAGLFSDWFDEWFEPGEHYLPIDLGYQNLEETLDWALHHDEEAEAIGRKGRQFALMRMRKEDMRCYMYRLLLEYSAILD